MEYVAVKRTRKRKRRQYIRKRRREQAKLEVRSFKRQKLVGERGSAIFAREKLTTNTMNADSFWKNYTVAQEWQKRHSVTWWRSRCAALEYENEMLKNKIRSLVCSNYHQNSPTTCKNNYKASKDVEETVDEDECDSEDENLEFQVDADMMTFLEQSIRHKMELKQKRESDLTTASADEENSQPLIGGAAWICTRNREAKLLYGNDSPRILAMETALQATMDRHKDKAKPQYWPNIPLKL